MAENRHILALVAAVGVLVALGLLMLTVMVVQERSAVATSPGNPGKIAYSAYDGTNEAIYTIDPGGGSKVKVTDKPGFARSPAYSPTGNEIAYSGHDGNDSEIYTIDPSGGGTFKVTDNDSNDFSPSYSPNGNNIAYVGYDGNDLEIYTIDVRGGNALKVTDNDTDDLYPSYSPNGQTIAYVGYPPSSQEYDGTNEAIYTMDARGGGNRSKVVDNASEPSYSPSGKQIAFLGDTPANPTIYTVEVGGGGKVKVTDTGAADSEPSWGSQ